jgi:hypothetical protein
VSARLVRDPHRLPWNGSKWLSSASFGRSRMSALGGSRAIPAIRVPSTTPGWRRTLGHSPMRGGHTLPWTKQRSAWCMTCPSGRSAPQVPERTHLPVSRPRGSTTRSERSTHGRPHLCVQREAQLRSVVSCRLLCACCGPEAALAAGHALCQWLRAAPHWRAQPLSDQASAFRLFPLLRCLTSGAAWSP